MSAGIYNTIIEQGATFFRTCTYKDANGDPINLTGYTVRAKLKRYPQDRIVAATFTCTILNQTSYAGQFTIELSAAQTAALECDESDEPGVRKLTKYMYDVELVSGSNVYRELEGVLSVSPEVTS